MQSSRVSFLQSWLCKTIGCVQCMAVFLSSASITLIALDRYRFILHPHASQMSTLMVGCFQDRNERQNVLWLLKIVFLKGFSA